MKVEYNGYVVEGSVEEMESLLGTRKSVTLVDDEGEKIDGRKSIGASKKGRPLSKDHLRKLRKGIKKYWKGVQGGTPSEDEPKKYSGLVIHKELTTPKLRKRNGKLSSVDVLNVFESYDKRQHLQFTDLYKDLQKSGKIPKTYNIEKYKQILSDRLYFLGNNGNLKITKQGHKNFYKLA